MLRILALAAACAYAAQAKAPPITVSAAVSLAEALEEAAKAYTATGGGAVRFNFAGSNVLARQIVNGAPVDLFVSADAAQMRLVEQAGMVAAGAAIPLLGNQLAIIVHKSSTTAPASAAALAEPTVRRIAIGDPQAVPAGVYAREYLERAGLWTALSLKVLPFPNVRAALAAVEHGGADAGIVYVTDARPSSTVRVTAVIRGPGASSIVYPAAVLPGSRQKAEALRFLTFLQTAEAAQIFERHGFQPLPPRR